MSRLGWALAVLASLGLHAAYKAHAHEPLQELLWGCHLASLACALGLALGWPRLVAAAFLYHLGVGIPGWLLDALGTGQVGATSLLVHVVPPLAGAVSVRRHGLPWLSCADAYAFLLATWALAWVATDPALNVSAAFRAWGGLRELLPDERASRAFNALAAVPCLLAATLLARRLVLPRALRSGAGAG